MKFSTFLRHVSDLGLPLSQPKVIDPKHFLMRGVGFLDVKGANNTNNMLRLKIKFSLHPYYSLSNRDFPSHLWSLVSGLWSLVSALCSVLSALCSLCALRSE